MFVTVLICLVGGSLASPLRFPRDLTVTGYGAPNQNSLYSRNPEECSSGEVRNSDGSCGVPEVSRKIFVFAAQPTVQPPPPKQPDPEVNIDVILVKTPGQAGPIDPVVVPPTEQKTVVYVLSKRPQQQQEVIEVPSSVDEPEVFFVNYQPGENPKLPGGIDLETALENATNRGAGTVIEEVNQGYSTP